jgi:hypothetical protein
MAAHFKVVNKTDVGLNKALATTPMTQGGAPVAGFSLNLRLSTSLVPWRRKRSEFLCKMNGKQ